NDRHPSSLGSVNSQILATTLGLYDPDRNRSVSQKDSEKTWDDFVSLWRRELPALAEAGGAGLAVLAESSHSPTRTRLINAFKKKFPQATWVNYEPLADEAALNGIALATGQRVIPTHTYSAAHVIVSFDADFIGAESENVTAARGFADGRRVTSEKDSMNRLYVVESGFSLTGSMADHRLRLRSADVPAFLIALGKELEAQGLGIAALRNVSAAGSFNAEWLRALAKDLLDNRGASLLVAGRRQPEAAHALVAALNDALGNTNSTVTYHAAPDAQFSSLTDFTALVERMNAGSVKTLMILGGNPSYASCGGVDFKTALKKVNRTIRLGLYHDETSADSEWHIPEAHYLESWGDARSVNGTAGVVQPLIDPLFGGKSVIEFLNFITTGADTGGYALVRETWKSLIRSAGFEQQWEIALHEGLLDGSAVAPERVSIKANDIAAALQRVTAPAGLELTFAPGALYDGRFANNGWLQELPDPITKVSWDNVASVSPATARELGVKTGDVVAITHENKTVELPAYVLPGHADKSVSLTFGYGRSAAGTIGTEIGSNVYPLFTAGVLTGATVARTGRRYTLANTQDHGSMEGRPIVREGDVAEYRANPAFVFEMDVETPPLNSLWPEHTYDTGYQWGMAIDLNACTGCNACAIACVSENNIPIVGKEQVGKGREMHWMRMDRYFTGDDLENPEMAHQPMACQHCEMAPCEQVCPVAATVHDQEGLNVMVYNRCIGTRYCSNNCPYKVRRFNFFNYTKQTPEVTK
ncbi:MAG TPA: 4Fe-4S dicluster domain-containing protein, partial [candidate division Zixibacteria bacterium]|nr:4Fe-4S dicluster domain-containing protein [candidate division Zixibacteria bacterium]